MISNRIERILVSFVLMILIQLFVSCVNQSSTQNQFECSFETLPPHSFAVGDGEIADLGKTPDSIKDFLTGPGYGGFIGFGSGERFAGNFGDSVKSREITYISDSAISGSLDLGFYLFNIHGNGE